MHGLQGLVHARRVLLGQSTLQWNISPLVENTGKHGKNLNVALVVREYHSHFHVLPDLHDNHNHGALRVLWQGGAVENVSSEPLKDEAKELHRKSASSVADTGIVLALGLQLSDDRSQVLGQYLRLALVQPRVRGHRAERDDELSNFQERNRVVLLGVDLEDVLHRCGLSQEVHHLDVLKSLVPVR